MIYSIYLTLIALFVIFDVYLFYKTDHKVRLSIGWKRFLPGSGFYFRFTK